MRIQHIIIGVYLTIIIVLLISIVALAIQLKSAKKKIQNLENIAHATTTTTTTAPNLKPSPMSFNTNTWIFDNAKPTCTKVIPLTINVPIQDPENCSTIITNNKKTL